MKNISDKDVFVRYDFSYLVTSGIALALFLGLLGGLSFILQNITGWSSRFGAVIITLLLVALLRPLKTRIDHYIDRIFFREKYEYKQTISKAAKVLISIIELDELISQMLNTVLDSLKTEKGVILLKDKKAGKFVLSSAMDFSAGFQPAVDTPGPGTALEKSDIFDMNFPVYPHFERIQKPLRIIQIEKAHEFDGNRADFLKFMQDLGIELAIPIMYEQNLVGVLGLGPKKSSQKYSGEDIDLLQTLMMQMAVSIENARKVEELKEMVELEASYRELRQVNEMKDDFFAMISHDLRTPMTSIKGYASLLYDKPEAFDADTLKEFLGIIIDESDRLTRLINDILDMQGFEADNVAMDMRELDMTKLVCESLDIFNFMAGEKNIVLEKDITDQNIMVRADYNRLQQVMSNLLSNAIKFTPEGGNVKTILEIISDNGNTMVKVSVSDTGPGISKEKEKDLFQKFHQGDNLVRGEEEGSGFGLALVRQIIEYHGGRVGVESELGKGSTFYFILESSDK